MYYGVLVWHDLLDYFWKYTYKITISSSPKKIGFYKPLYWIFFRVYACVILSKGEKDNKNRQLKHT